MKINSMRKIIDVEHIDDAQQVIKDFLIKYILEKKIGTYENLYMGRSVKLIVEIFED